MKVYSESKTANYTLQLDLFKRHIFPKQFSQQYEIKTV